MRAEIDNIIGQGANQSMSAASEIDLEEQKRLKYEAMQNQLN